MQCGKSVFDLISIEVLLTVVGKEWEMFQFCKYSRLFLWAVFWEDLRERIAYF